VIYANEMGALRIILMGYEDKLLVIEAQHALLEEQIGLIKRLQEIDEALVKGNVKSVALTPKAKDKSAIKAVVMPTDKKRGRKAGTTNKDAASGEGKKVKLPGLLQEVLANNGKPMAIDELVKAVKDAGYESNASDYGNMVYQGVRSLTKKGVFKQNANKEYSLA
jgi:hypothetical protein